MTKRAVVYGRVSKKDPISDRAGGQVEHLERVAAEAGYEVTHVLKDDGRSAWKENVPRPGWDEVQRLIGAGEVDVVMSTALDRFTRRGGVPMVLFATLCEENSTMVHTASNGVIDTSNPSSRLVMFIHGEQAESEQTEKSLRYKRRQDVRAKLGKPRGAGIEPFGWRRTKTHGQEYPVLQVHPDDGPRIADAIARLLAGDPKDGLRTLMKEWNRAGVPTARGKEWKPATLQAVLTRPSNSGQRVLRGEPLWNEDGSPVTDRPALVSQAQLDDLVALLDARKTGKAPNGPHLLSGTIRCYCGATMRTAMHSAGVGVYRCSVAADKAGGGHATVRRHLADSAAIEGTVDVLMHAPLSALHGEASSGRLSALYGRREEIRGMVANLIDAVARGELTGSDIGVRKRELLAEDDDVARRINELRAADHRTSLVFDARRTLWHPKADEDDATVVLDSGETITIAGIPGHRAVSIGEAAEVRTELMQRFRALPTEVQRSLVRASVSVSVGHGRGAKRVDVRPVIPMVEEDPYLDLPARQQPTRRSKGKRVAVKA